MKLRLVIPCYNEELRLPVEQIRSFAREQKDIRLLLVNDGSTDDTRRVLRELASAVPDRIAVLNLERNVGKGEAVRAGMRKVLEEGGAELTGFWDGDLATPLDQIPRFIEYFERPAVEMVIGSRVKLLGRDIRRRAIRHYLGRVAATAISVSLGIAVYDTQCGAKMFRISPTLESMVAEPFVSRWLFDVELLVRLDAALRGTDRDLSDAVVELPLMKWVDIAGSKVKGADFARAGRDLVRIARHYR